MLTTANGKTVVEATVYLPRAGVWHADLVVDTTDITQVTGAIALSIADGALVLKGSSFRTTATGAPVVWMGLTRVRMAAGAAGLGTQLAPIAYASGTPVSVILGDILSGAGEAVSSTSSSNVLGATLPAWARVAQSAGTALTQLSASLSATWRSMLDGTVWLGNESWPASAIADFSTVRKSTHDGRIEVVSSNPAILPGTVFAGGNVGRVVHRISARAVRTEVLFE